MGVWLALAALSLLLVGLAVLVHRLDARVQEIAAKLHALDHDLRG